MTTETWLSQLQENGYRLTEARRAVVDTVANANRALTPLEVFDLARPGCQGLGLVTVYRTLEKLEELELIERVHQPQGCQAFISAGRGHDHLLLCSKCGRAVRFSGDEMETLISSISAQTGYVVTDHWLQLLGLCRNCQ